MTLSLRRWQTTGLTLVAALIAASLAAAAHPQTAEAHVIPVIERSICGCVISIIGLLYSTLIVTIG